MLHLRQRPPGHRRGARHHAKRRHYSPRFWRDWLRRGIPGPGVQPQADHGEAARAAPRRTAGPHAPAEGGTVRRPTGGAAGRS